MTGKTTPWATIDDLARTVLLPWLEPGEYLYNALARSLADDDQHDRWSIVEGACMRLEEEFTATLTTRQRERYEELRRSQGMRRNYADGYTALHTLATLFGQHSPRSV